MKKIHFIFIFAMYMIRSNKNKDILDPDKNFDEKMIKNKIIDCIDINLNPNLLFNAAIFDKNIFLKKGINNSIVKKQYYNNIKLIQNNGHNSNLTGVNKNIFLFLQAYEKMKKEMLELKKEITNIKETNFQEKKIFFQELHNLNHEIETLKEEHHQEKKKLLKKITNQKTLLQQYLTEIANMKKKHELEKKKMQNEINNIVKAQNDSENKIRNEISMEISSLKKEINKIKSIQKKKKKIEFWISKKIKNIKMKTKEKY